MGGAMKRTAASFVMLAGLGGGAGVGSQQGSQPFGPGGAGGRPAGYGARPMGGAMKRTAASFVMLAGLGGCAGLDSQQDSKPFGQVSVGKEITNLKGPNGEPVHIAAAGQMPTDKKVVTA